VNAVAHRDYTSTASVQVMLFADRLEVRNPGYLPASLTLLNLREAHSSVPRNPLLAEPMYLAQYVEKMGTGTGDMIQRCREVGLPEPQFSQSDGFMVTIRRKVLVGSMQPESGPESNDIGPESNAEGPESNADAPASQPQSLEARVLRLPQSGPQSKSEIAKGLGHKSISSALKHVITIMAADQNIEYTIPDKPQSRLQKYRITEKGEIYLERLTRKP
jgi:predicted HTH transcriptional regulator